jgi:hypothetical protein
MKNPKFYEFDSNNFAYYALIVAETAEDAKTAYENEVGDIEDDAEPKEITAAAAKDKLAHADSDDGQPEPEQQYEYAVNSTEPYVLLIDSTLI